MVLPLGTLGFILIWLLPALILLTPAHSVTYLTNNLTGTHTIFPRTQSQNLFLTSILYTDYTNTKLEGPFPHMADYHGNISHNSTIILTIPKTDYHWTFDNDNNSFVQDMSLEGMNFHGTPFFFADYAWYFGFEDNDAGEETDWGTYQGHNNGTTIGSTQYIQPGLTGFERRFWNGAGLRADFIGGNNPTLPANTSYILSAHLTFMGDTIGASSPQYLLLTNESYWAIPNYATNNHTYYYSHGNWNKSICSLTYTLPTGTNYNTWVHTMYYNAGTDTLIAFLNGTQYNSTTCEGRTAEDVTFYLFDGAGAFNGTVDEYFWTYDIANNNVQDIASHNCHRGYCYNFMQPDDHILLSNTYTNLQLTAGGTISAWIYPRSDDGYIFDKSTGVGGTNGYTFHLGNDQSLRFRATTVNLTYSAANSITLDEWQHVAVVFNSTGRALYRNGIDITNTGATYTVLPPANVDETSIGNQHGGLAAGFDGMIDDVTVWNISLSPDQIKFYYNQSLPSQGSGIYDSNITYRTTNDTQPHSSYNTSLYNLYLSITITSIAPGLISNINLTTNDSLLSTLITGLYNYPLSNQRKFYNEPWNPQLTGEDLNGYHQTTSWNFSSNYTHRSYTFNMTPYSLLLDFNASTEGNIHNEPADGNMSNQYWYNFSSDGYTIFQTAFGSGDKVIVQFNPWLNESHDTEPIYLQAFEYINNYAPVEPPHIYIIDQTTFIASTRTPYYIQFLDGFNRPVQDVAMRIYDGYNLNNSNSRFYGQKLSDDTGRATFWTVNVQTTSISWELDGYKSKSDSLANLIGHTQNPDWTSNTWDNPLVVHLERDAGLGLPIRLMVIPNTIRNTTTNIYGAITAALYSQITVLNNHTYIEQPLTKDDVGIWKFTWDDGTDFYTSYTQDLEIEVKANGIWAHNLTIPYGPGINEAILDPSLISTTGLTTRTYTVLSWILLLVISIGLGGLLMMNKFQEAIPLDVPDASFHVFMIGTVFLLFFNVLFVWVTSLCLGYYILSRIKVVVE